MTRSRPSVAVVPTDLRHHLGRIGEDLALAHLERLGYALVARNHRTRYGELDLVVFDGDDAGLRGGQDAAGQRDAGAGRGRRCTSESAGRSAGWPRPSCSRSPIARTSPDLRFDAIGVVIDAYGKLVRLDHLEAAF